MPRLNARAMAEMIALPGYKQLALLRRQKYPKAGAGKFIVPYYGPALAGVRGSLTSNDPAAAIQSAEAKVQSLGNESRRDNIIRALESYKKSGQLGRSLTIEKNTKTSASIGGVEVRASADLFASDDKGRPVVLYYNWNALAMDHEEAKRVLEIAHWVYEESGSEISENRFELFDLASGSLVQIKKRRTTTIAQMKDTATMIESVWDALEPPA